MTYDDLEAWLRLAASRLHDQRAELTELDSAIGDGDHGINMDRGFTAIVAKLDQTKAAPAATVPAEGGVPDPASLLRTAGRTLISTVGGASGPLYGTAFLKAAVPLAGHTTLGGAELVAALDAAANGVATLGKSTEGEKTMLDALRPAVTAARAALEAGADVRGILRAAREAADAGALATVPMVATKGRASYLGERSVGHQDPGATSAALLVGALADAVGER